MGLSGLGMRMAQGMTEIFLLWDGSRLVWRLGWRWGLGTYTQGRKVAMWLEFGSWECVMPW